MKKIRRYLRAHWRLVSGIALGLLGLGFVLVYKLGSLSGGLSDGEVKQLAFSSSWRHIAQNPLNAPFTTTQWLIHTVAPHDGQTVARLTSVLFGILTVVAFGYIVRRWYGIKTAVYSTALFSLSSWFLHVSRYAGPQIIYLWALLLLVALYIAWERHLTKLLATVLAFSLLAILLYVPGLIWLVLVSGGLQYRSFKDGWHNLKQTWQKIVALLIPVILIIPLVMSFFAQADIFRQWLGLPAHFASFGAILRQLVHAVSFFVWRGPFQPELWLDRLPIIGIFSIAMAAFGIIFYAKHLAAPRTRLLAVLFVIAAVLFALGGPTGISLVVPIIYLIVTAGIGYLLHEWLRVFPKNPLARGVGFGLLAILVAAACLYNTRAYFIAWPHNVSTKPTFHNHL